MSAYQVEVCFLEPLDNDVSDALWWFDSRERLFNTSLIAWMTAPATAKLRQAKEDAREILIVPGGEI